MLRAMAIGGQRDTQGFRAALNEVRTKFPGTDEERAATELLAALDRTSGTPPENPRKAGTTGEYKPDAGQHYFALIVPNSGTDLNAIKTSISTFNRDYYPATLCRCPTPSWTPNTKWFY